MIDDVKSHLISIVIGIKFGPSFSIVDKSGEIADRILYRKNSFFSDKMFTLVNANPLEIQLNNDKSGDNLIVTSKDIILTCNLDNPNVKQDLKISPTIPVNDVKKINDNFEKDIVNGLMKEFSFPRIHRIGYINKYIFSEDGLADKFSKRTIADTIDGISDINVRFSKKYPTPVGIIQKGNTDYHTIIFNISKRSDKDELVISLDYQAYYDPPLEKVGDMDFSNYISLMENFNTNSFPKWLNKNYGGAVV